MAIEYEKSPLIWENKGTEPPETLKQTGWQPAQKPPSAYFNYQFANTGDCIKELQDKLSEYAQLNDKEKEEIINQFQEVVGDADFIHPANDNTEPSENTPREADLLGGHDASYFATVDSAATAETYFATIPTTWNGDSAPYTQTVTVTGITSTDTPIVDVILSTTTDTALNQLEAWGCVSKIETGTDSITVTCLEDKPITAIPIQLKVVR